MPKSTLRITSPDWRFHHLGVASQHMMREVEGWRLYGYSQEGEAFEDLVQGVRGVFLTGPGPRLEILEALPGSTVLNGWIERGIRIYHQGFETRDIRVTISSVLPFGAKVVVGP